MAKRFAVAYSHAGVEDSGADLGPIGAASAGNMKW